MPSQIWAIEKRWLLITVWLLLPGSLFAQSTASISQEKVYLHSDRAQYVAGDTIWFRASLFDATTHHPSTVSELVHVTLQRSSSVVIETKWPLQAGNGSGWLAIPRQQEQGNYQLAAYTNLMRNDDEAFFFRKFITVISPIQSAGQPAPAPGVAVQFFPEGGQWVAGAVSKLAFKAIDETGRGVAVEGIIETDRGEIITDFKTAYRGMGAVSLLPQAGQTYRAKITYRGETKVIPLPPVLPDGASLLVDPVTRPQTIKVWVTPPKTTNPDLKLVAQLRGQVLSETRLTAIEADRQLIEIPYSSLPESGILQITLVENQQPIRERLVFVDRKQHLRLNATSVTNAQPRSPNQLTVTVTNAQGKPIEADFSVAVTDAAQDTDGSVSPSLPAYLLLTSDLKGYVEQPNAYFDGSIGDSTKARLYTDYLMLTQGWRRFVQPNEASNSLTHEPEKGLPLTGTAYSSKNAPVLNEMLKLTTWDKSGLRVWITQTDATGRFTLTTALTDSVRILSTDSKGRDIRLALDRFAPTVQPQPLFTQPSVPMAIAAQLIENSLLSRQLGKGGIQLQAVEVKAKLPDRLQNDPRTSLYLGKPNRIIEVASDKSMQTYLSVGELLAGRVEGSAVILVDGIRDPPLELVRAQDIDRIDVISDITLVSMLGGTNASPMTKVVNILTKRGIERTISTLDARPMQKWYGYSVERVFYEPNYSVSETTQQPDRRATLYWNPALRTDKQGRAVIRFFNSDVVRQPVLTIEGTDGRGQAGSLQKPLH
ncbi:MAG: hypothetical protein EAZ91_10020 [Cytophagales bacterium]|nr:MAG: hypothetical protein EAZ91_10020 [Cytophagales bacterium]